MKPVHLIGVPLDLGGGRRGVDMGPSAFRIAGLADQIRVLGRTVVDRGNVPAPLRESGAIGDERKSTSTTSPRSAAAYRPPPTRRWMRLPSR